VNFTNNSSGYDQPLNYAWDFNNDGSIDSNAPNPSYTYTNTGTYSVSLTVTDSDGSANTLTRYNYITVSPSGCINLPVTIAGTAQYYSTLQEAYNEALEGDTIMTQADVITGDINMNSDIALAIVGGYDCNYTSIIGDTTLNGNMTVNDGAVTIENFTLQ
jgi:PKD repeat protein